MRLSYFWRLLVLLQILLSISSFALADIAIAPDGIIIKYKSANRYVNHGEFIRHNGRNLEVVRHTDRVATSPSNRWQRLWRKIENIRKDDNVLYAEPNYSGHFDNALLPVSNGPPNSRQWWLSAVSDKALLTLGRGTGVVVAVIDTGVDLTHPDLAENLLSNGYNFGDGNHLPQDVSGHGTMMAGIIAASGNMNSFGVASLAPEAKILPIKINAGGEDVFTSEHLASAIDYAVSHQAMVINLSLTVENQTQTVRNSIQNALNQGVIVVASAGNHNGPVEFPANMPGVIAVAAVDKFNQLAAFSNFGSEISVAAPGVDIFTTALGHGYGSGSGTSFSTPIVAAAIADLMSINMTLPASAFTHYLRDHATVMSGGNYSFGSLNAGASGNSLVPHLQLNKKRFNQLDSVEINYDLPRTGAAVHIFVAVKTPFGEFSLLPDGAWLPVVAGQYGSIARSYENKEAVNGILFGRNGLFSSIPLSGLPSGNYVWRTAIVSPASGKLIGGITESIMHLD